MVARGARQLDRCVRKFKRGCLCIRDLDAHCRRAGGQVALRTSYSVVGGDGHVFISNVSYVLSRRLDRSLCCFLPGGFEAEVASYPVGNGGRRHRRTSTRHRVLGTKRRFQRYFQGYNLQRSEERRVGKE